MTAYLKRGDIIHIVTPAKTPAENQQLADEFIKIYALFGITVSMVTQEIDCQQSAVISVIRPQEEVRIT